MKRVTDRPLVEEDLPLLALSLAADVWHKTTEPEFFFAPGSAAKVYEDEAGPIMFVRGAKALRLDIQYVSNADVRRNMNAMLQGFGQLVERAREHGFSEIIFNTSSAPLSAFCQRRLGFVESKGELRKAIA